MAAFNFKSFIIQTLRRGSYRYAPRNEAKNAAKLGRNQYVCAMCKNVFGNKDIEIDHIVPVVGVDGFTTWDDYINGMYPAVSGFQVLCKPHHKEKTEAENLARKIRRQAKKGLV